MPAATTTQTVRTLRPYETEAYGYKLTVPAGAIVSNSTACGPDNECRFWVYYRAEVMKQHGKTDDGTPLTPYSLLADLEYRGLNIPAEYCEPYK